MANNKKSSQRAVVESSKRQLTTEQQRLYRFLTTADPQVRSISTKLVEDEKRLGEKGVGAGLPKDALRGLSSKTSFDIIDINNIKRNIPELETVRDILVSSILSPQDMINENLSFTLDGEFPHRLGSELLSIVEKHFTDHYKLQDKLFTMLSNALFDRGSHILAILPESAIDDIINRFAGASMESFRDALTKHVDDQGHFISNGVFGRGLKEQHDQKAGQTNKSSFEHFFKEQHVRDMRGDSYDIIPGLLTVVDNIDALKASRILRALSESQINNRYQAYSAESVMFYGDMTEEEKKALPVNTLYKRAGMQGSWDGITVINDRESTSRRSVGHPLVLDIPHESTIPVFTPGNPEDHIGYIVLIDENGNPVTYTQEQENLDKLNSGASITSMMQTSDPNQGIGGGTYGVVTQTLDTLNKLNGGTTCDWAKLTSEKLVSLYAELVERDLMARFNDGVYGKNISIPRPLEIYQIMLSRALSGSKTQLIYIPETLMEYVAFYYNDLGIGQSLITKSKTIAAHRIAMNYANTRALIRNAVGTKVLNVTVDDDEVDVEEVVAQAISRTMEANSFSRLFSSFDPRQIESSMNSYGYEVNVQGGEAIEKTEISMEYKQGDIPTVDTDYMEAIKKEYIGSFIPPSLLDAVGENEFAIEFITKNALYAKRNIIIARRFNSFITSFVGKYVLHDGLLISELSDAIRKEYRELDDETIKKCKDERSTIPAIRAFLDTLRVAIPLPDSNATEVSAQAMENYQKRVEGALQHYIDQDYLGSVFSDLDDERRKEAIDMFKDRMLSFFMVRWMDKNSYFPEYNEVVSLTDEEMSENNLIDQVFNQQAEMAEVFSDIFKRIKDRITPGESEGGGDDYSSSSDTTETEPSGSDDDFSFGDDIPEEPEEPETPEEEKPEEENKEESEEDKSKDENSEETSDENTDTSDADGGSDTTDANTDETV